MPWPKGYTQPHIELILTLHSEGFAKWQIVLWNPGWDKPYLKSIIQSRRRRFPDDIRFRPNVIIKRQYTLENWMDHQPRYRQGMPYQCLRCKRECDELSEFDTFECTADAKEFRGNAHHKRRLHPMARLKHGLKHYKKG